MNREYKATEKSLCRDAALVFDALQGLEGHKMLAVLGYVIDTVLDEFDPCTRAAFVKVLERKP
jgi:hypothetical protein